MGIVYVNTGPRKKQTVTPRLSRHEDFSVQGSQNSTSAAAKDTDRYVFVLTFAKVEC